MQPDADALRIDGSATGLSICDMTDRATKYHQAAEYLRQHGHHIPETWLPGRIIDEAERRQAQKVPGDPASVTETCDNGTHGPPQKGATHCALLAPLQAKGWGNSRVTTEVSHHVQDGPTIKKTINMKRLTSEVSGKEVPRWSDIADSLLQLAKTAKTNKLSANQALAMRAFYATVLSDKAQTFSLQEYAAGSRATASSNASVSSANAETASHGLARVPLASMRC